MVKGFDRAAWLEERKHSIGGSDAAALCGMNPYSTPFTVWADKTGRIAEKDDNEAMRQGRDLEQYVAERFFEKTGKRVHVQNGIIRNKKYPFAHATIDRKISGERAGLECKTTSTLNLGKFLNGEFPANYYAQCVHYLAVTGWDRWYLAVLVLGRDFLVYTIERDDDEIAALMEIERRFWENYVLKDVPPPADGLDPTGEAIKTIYTESFQDGRIDLFGREQIVKDFVATEELISAYKKENEERKQILMLDLGENERGDVPGFSVTWKRQTRSSFDFKAFQKDNPALDLAPYMRQTDYRIFKVKEIAE